MLNPKPGLRAILGNLAASLIGLTMALLVLEIALVWIIPPPLRYRYPQPLYDSDPQIGWVMKPHQNTFTIDMPVTTNSLGFRSPEISTQWDPARLRVLCLGDSQTFGNGVAQDETYPALLQPLLATRRSGRPVDVVNAGVQGYDPEQEVQVLERMAPVLHPDVVTLAMYLNDIDETTSRDNFAMLDPRTGEFKRTGLKSLTPYRLIYLVKRTRLYTLLDWRLGILRSGGSSNPLTSVLEGKTPHIYDEGWRKIEAALSRAKSLASERGFRLILFPVPNAQEFRQSYPHEQFRSRIASLATNLGIESFDPTPELKAAGGGFERYFIMWDGHISVPTHRFIAAKLADLIAGAPSPVTGANHARRAPS